MSIPATNADGAAAIPFTDEQRYVFDVQGWIAIPDVLSDDQVGEMREFTYRLHRDRDSISPAHRSSIGGPLEALTDHPIVLGFMNEFVAHLHHASEECYGFRFEGSFSTIRGAGHDNFSPHGGNGMLRFPGNHHTYHVVPGKAHSGLTRVVWELNQVRDGDGGTAFLCGSHKAAFGAPPSLLGRDSPRWESYSCPAGSVLFFTEAITHTGWVWSNTEWDRVAIFNSYNTVGSKWHKWEPHPEQLTAMPPKRQTLFRGVYCQDNVVRG